MAVAGAVLLAAVPMLIATARASRAKDADGAEAADAPEDRVAPFRLKGLDGQLFDSEQQLAGRVSVVFYWRTGQRHSLRCLESLVQLHSEYSAEDVGFATFVSGDADRAEVARVAEELKLPFPVLFDRRHEVYGEFGTIVSPTTWFIDRDQIRRFKYPGCRRDFAVTARADVDLLLGRISQQEREKRVEHKAAPPSKGLVGAPVRYRLAKRMLAKGNRKAARKELIRAWQAKPPLADAGVDLGLMLLADGENAEARKILERAAELAPQNLRALGAKGLALMRTGDVDAGGALLERALATDVAEPILYYEMGRLSEQRGSMADAARYYRKGLELVVLPRGPAD